jgi:hypothetical protein
MAGLDPAIHSFRKKLDCRVKPGNDERGFSAPIRMGLSLA